MAKYNPYAPSRASLTAGSATAGVDSEVRVWRDGKFLVCRHDASLPARCVKCNEPAELPTKVRTVYWVHPALYLLFLAGLPILLIVYMIVRKKADVDPGLCAKHKMRRIVGIAVGWLAPLIGLMLLIGVGDYPVLGWISLALIVGGIVMAFAWGRLIYVKKIEPREVRLGGICRPYLDELPEYPG